MTGESIERFTLELCARIASGVPIIYVLTHEEDRAREAIFAAVGKDRVSVWTSTRGLDANASLRIPVLGIQAAVTPERPIRLLCDLHPYAADPQVVRALRDFAQGARALGATLILLSPILALPVEIERDVAVLDLPLPDAGEAETIFDAVPAPARARDGEGDQTTFGRDAFVRAALGLTHAEIVRAFYLAAQERDPAVALARVVAEKSAALRRSSTLELIAPEVTLDDVGGLEVLKAWLRSRVLAFDEGARAFGLAEPRGMLVCGVQGCGKSLVSKAAARVLGLPLVRLDFADVFSMASPEAALREAMRVVEALAPLVLWVDEIEKGLGDGMGDAGQSRVFGAFLTWLQEHRGLVFVAATANEVDRLPPELARRGRFDEIFFVDLPSVKERQDILKLQLVRCGRDPVALATDPLGEELEHFSGAELEQVVKSALFRAYANKRDVTIADLRGAARETTPLAVLYEEKIQALRAWGKARARRASADRRTLDLFGD